MPHFYFLEKEEYVYMDKEFLKKKLFGLLEKNEKEMISIRRYLHQHPEVSFNEFKTAQYIHQFYTKNQIKVRTGVGGNGLVATVYGEKPGNTVALRADFDALPIQDEKEVPYRSKNHGVMHACGHDGHTATLLVLAKALHDIREHLPGTYVIIHQHAEEIAPGGAISMVEDGCLAGVDAIFGTHLWATEPVGTVATKTGAIMAAADRFEITIQGAGGHGAQPHRTKDAIVTASQLVINLQQIVSRNVNPVDAAVLSVGSFIANNAFNIIADKVVLSGTVRTFKPDVQQLIKQAIERVTHGTCLAAQCTYTLDYHHGYPAVVNHEAETVFLKQIAHEIKEVTNVRDIEPQMSGEDFAYYLQQVKGCLFFTGAMPQTESEVYPHHHPKFDIDERALLIAAKTLGLAAITYNDQQKDLL